MFPLFHSEVKLERFQNNVNKNSLEKSPKTKHSSQHGLDHDHLHPHNHQVIHHHAMDLFQNGICPALSKPNMQHSKHLNTTVPWAHITILSCGVSVVLFRLHFYFLGITVGFLRSKGIS